jgi:hypothetical protein
MTPAETRLDEPFIVPEIGRKAAAPEPSRTIAIETVLP